MNKAPFTDDELERIIKSCDMTPIVEWKNSISSGVWSGNDLKDFVWTMIYTGLRISDVLRDTNAARFRHTFARILPEKSAPVSDVADLLGDDEKTVREHYARWALSANLADSIV